MPLFTYKARDKKDKIVEDTIQAANRQDAVSLLKADGFQVFTVRDLDRGFSSLFGSKISVAEKATFCRFIATMLRAGLSLPESVEIIKQESTNKQMRKILADIAFQVRKGKSLSSVLSQYKEVFDPVFLTLVKAGEESGSLAQTFDYLAKQLLATHELSQNIKGALMYPAVIVGRGANFILPEKTVLRVRVIAPFETRVEHAIKDEKINEKAAKTRLRKVHRQRKEFIKKYFNKNISNANYYDLVLNTKLLTVNQAVEIIITAFKERFLN